MSASSQQESGIKPITSGEVKLRNRTSSVSEFNTYTDGNIMSAAVREGNDNPAAVMKANLTGASAEKTTEAKRKKKGDNNRYDPSQEGLLSDIVTFRWMTQPSSSLKLAGIIILAYVNWQIFTPTVANPFEPFLFISHRVPITQVAAVDATLALKGDLVRYQKGYKDIPFLLFYVIVFSFLRQSTTLYVFEPFAAWWGIKNQRKRERFMEQGYALLYWGGAGLMGLYVMSFQESWWMNFEHLWIKYPHWQMRAELKIYYLLQFSFWLQQALVMLLRLEAPRKDYYELIAHHLVTLWLIGWSYLVNLTQIGTTVFVSMDVPDAWLAAAKAFNYLGKDTAANVTFALLMGIWTYFRIYTSGRALWSVWYQFDLIPRYTREWNPSKGWWLVPWMRYQIFAPLFILLLLNIFWYMLMWRIMIRAITNSELADEREEGEYDEEEEAAKALEAEKKGK